MTADPSADDPRLALAGRAVDVAPRLLGWTLSHTTDDGTVAVVLTEVEAYEGEQDPASHAFRGRTGRNDIMFGRAGHLYTYLSYGMHWCCNVVTGPSGRASAVLLRAGRVVEGADLARSRRGAGVPASRLARGPGCLGQALGLGSAQNGADLLGDGPTRLVPPTEAYVADVSSGHRVGVSVAHDVPWRFWITGDPTVSAYRRSPRAR